MKTYKYPYFDAHCDTISAGLDLRKNLGHVDLERGTRFPHYAQLFAIFADAQTTRYMVAECRRQRERFVSETEKNSDIVMVCRTGKDLDNAEKSGKIAAIQSIEGGELLGCEPAMLNTAKEWGVRSINLTWNHANALSGSNCDEAERGLSPVGREFVRRAQELNILMDVSHVSDRGFYDLLDITEKPIIASHSDSRELCPRRRNLTDEMFKEIMATGGCVGINLYYHFIGRNNLIDDVLAHIERFLDLGGEKHVGFGCDFDGCDELPDGIEGIESMELIAEAMERKNYSSTLIEDIFYNNMRRLIFKGEE
ncbi:MAG: dipeptidase [Oscillospiraceae bacterium]|nr:dipeptidase [Oscillospiraceae bacterium]